MCSSDLEIAYWTGVAWQGLNDAAKAAECWNQAAGAGASEGTQSYYQALCLWKLGQNDRAKALFQALVDTGRKMLQQPASGGGQQTPRARLANAHYLAGLGYLGLDEREKARAELSEAVETSPDLLGARATLAGIAGFRPEYSLSTKN